MTREMERITGGYVALDEWLPEDARPPERMSSFWNVDHRYSWWVPSSLVAVDWRGQESEVLDAARAALGLGAGVRLRMEFEAAMVFDAGGVAHRPDRWYWEPDRVATLAVAVGREPGRASVVVTTAEDDLRRLEHKIARNSERGCEVLIYHLMLDDADDWLDGREAQVEEVARLLRRYVPRAGGGDVGPREAVFLVPMGNPYEFADVRYGPEGLRGADALRRAMLERAAELADCEVTLKWADVRERREVVYDDREMEEALGVYWDWMVLTDVRTYKVTDWTQESPWIYDEACGWSRSNGRLAGAWIMPFPRSRYVRLLGRKPIDAEFTGFGEDVVFQRPVLVVSAGQPGFSNGANDEAEQVLREAVEHLELLRRVAHSQKLRDGHATEKERVWRNRWFTQMPRYQSELTEVPDMLEIVLGTTWGDIKADLGSRAFLEFGERSGEAEERYTGEQRFDRTRGSLVDFVRALVRAPYGVRGPLLDELCEVLAWASCSDLAIEAASATCSWRKRERCSDVSRRLREVALQHLAQRTDPQARTLEVRLCAR